MVILRYIARIFGWLLTPLVAWAASFLGAALGAIVSGWIGDPLNALAATVFSGAMFAVAATIGWMRLLRRSPRLQQALAVTREGVPIAVSEEFEKDAQAREHPREPFSEQDS